jgi:hypothetical protein
MTLRFVKPTAQDIALRDEIAEVSHLDEQDASRSVAGRIDYFRNLLAAGRTVTEIAIDYHLRNVVGLNAQEARAVLDHFRESGVDVRSAVSDFRWSDFSQMQRVLDLYVLMVRGSRRFYTGKAGEDWVSEGHSESFSMSRAEAERKAALFNSRTVLTGLTFVVV